MNPGKLDKRVTIQQLGASQDAYGQLVQTWSTVATVWAAVAPKTGRELALSKSVQSEVDTAITIRYRTGVASAMRILHGSTVYNIEAVINPESKNKFLVLECTTGVNNG